MNMNDHQRRFPRGVFAMVLATVLATGACSSSHSSKGGTTGGSADGKAVPPSSTVAPASVASTPEVLDPNALSLPIEQYEMTPAQNNAISRAKNELAVQCMKRFGFTITPPASGNGTATAFLDRRYGATNATTAAQWGYHLPNTGGKPSEPNLDTAQMQVLTGSTDTNRAGTTAAPTTGTPLVVAGQQVPKGGCMAEATEKLTTAGGTLGEPDIVRQIDHDGYNRSAADPRVTATFAKWSACMKGKGYSYASPIEAENDKDFAGRVASPKEIAVATADVSCKQQTKVVGTWLAVDAAYEKAEIDVNASTLAGIKQGNDTLLKAADKVLGTSS
ncbi:MAG: hypothetical protein JF597_00330 [Streptomyces sp.]|uniref:hypothetical protein n=1 Tax=Streptomyces sp. TaxID=1931 RepID=UPI0025F48C53|nr:hypothetical protein [Streptomyces sp.]MBW8792091.1 hypothetical protein [Streptomyces sp.]